jgi:tetratricopeptide (TPR) repeat protein
MERPANKLMTILLTMVFCLAARGNNKSEIYSAFITGDMQQWKQVMEKMDNNKTLQPDYILELVNYQYGYIAWCIGNEMDDEAEECLKRADENIEFLEGKKYDLSMVYAYKAAFYGYRIGMNVYKAPFYGPKSYSWAENSISQNKNNPFAYLQYANVQFYMPSAFGGSKKEAIEYYTKAEKLMEQDMKQALGDWNYLNLLTTIANAYKQLKQPDKAKNYFEKILKIEPNYSWVKNYLYPQLLKDLKEE